MKLLIDDTTARTHNLNANEVCVYAAILKCTKAGRGWFANYRDLANALPFVISHETVRRAVEKLFNLGLIERREKALFALTQNVTDLTQNVTDLTQNVTEPTQNVLPPNNPPINNNMNEKEKEQPRALRTHDGEEQQDCLFEKFWKFFSVAMPAEFHNRKGATKIAFEKRSEVAQRAMVEAAQEGAPGHPGDSSNPYFFVVDFPEPAPTNWQGTAQGGEMLNDGTAKIALYNGRYGVYMLEDIDLFKLELSDYQRANPTRN